MGGGWDSEEQQADRISCGKVGGARRLLTVLWEAYELGAWFFLICVNSVVQLVDDRPSIHDPESHLQEGSEHGSNNGDFRPRLAV